jgi:hypothetical protein
MTSKTVKHIAIKTSKTGKQTVEVRRGYSSVSAKIAAKKSKKPRVVSRAMAVGRGK